jgi:signal transduction histidine kinase
MLDFAKPLSLKMERGSIKKVIDSCLETMDVRLREKEIAVEKRYSDHRLKRLLFDAEKLEQAVINILINSIDALPEGGTIEISTRVLTENNGCLRVDFSDNGPGISSEDLPYIFDPFFSSKKKGTGLGLMNVKKIIEAHGGRVDVAPKKPQGTIISTTLPMKEDTP